MKTEERRREDLTSSTESEKYQETDRRREIVDHQHGNRNREIKPDSGGIRSTNQDLKPKISETEQEAYNSHVLEGGSGTF